MAATSWADAERTASWRRSTAYAAPVVAVVLGLYVYWFVIADRYAVFLYDHLGATPFDAVTSSRYWVAGLVAAAIVFVGYNGVVWMVGRVASARGIPFAPPAWWRVWLATAAPVAAGIVLVAGALGSPSLALPIAIASAAACLAGLALALWPSRLVALQPVDAVWLAADGVALAPILLLLRVVELPGSGLSVTPAYATAIASVSVAASVIGLLGLSVVRALVRLPASPPYQPLLAGLAFSYLGMPLLHHLFFTPPGYKYISTGSNFFASGVVLQIAVLAVAGALALGATAVRRRLDRRRADAAAAL